MVMGAGETITAMAADADLAGSAMEVAERTPHAPGLQVERDQDTPLLCGSFATLAVRICVCANWSVTDAGETATEVAAWGGGVVVVGGPPVGEGLCALEFEGTEAQPLPRTEASAQSTAITTGARRSEERRVGKECRSRWSPY